MPARAFIIGAATLPLNPQPAQPPLQLLANAVTEALADAGVALHEVCGMVASPSLAPGASFMPAHAAATLLGLVPCDRHVILRTIDTGGASPISGLLQARRMIEQEGCDVVVVASADAVGSLPSETFRQLADGATQACPAPGPRTPQTAPWPPGPRPPQTAPWPPDPKPPQTAPRPPQTAPWPQLAAGATQMRSGSSHQALPSPVIPSAYDMVARWQMQKEGGSQLSRRQLAMCSSLMSLQASRHPNALTRKVLSVEEVLEAPHVAPNTSVLECARRADGGAAVVLASERFTTLSWRPSLAASTSSPLAPTCLAAVEVIGGGEASGPSLPAESLDESSVSSCQKAVQAALQDAGLVSDSGSIVGFDVRVEFDYYGLYDCFPICLVRAIEAVGLAPPGGGGAFIENLYQQHVELASSTAGTHGNAVFNINTHGGLLCQGAPWEAPAMYSLVEAVEQLRHRATGRQVHPLPITALVYGNGGVFSASAVAILRRFELGTSRNNAGAAPNSRL